MTTTPPEETGQYYASRIEAAEDRFAAAEQERAAIRDAILNGDESVTAAGLGDADRAIEFASLALEGARRAQHAFLERCNRDGWARVRDAYRANTLNDPRAEVRARLDALKADAAEKIGKILADVAAALEPAERHNAAISQLQSYINGAGFVDPATAISPGGWCDPGDELAAFVLDVLPEDWKQFVRKSSPTRIVMTPR